MIFCRKFRDMSTTDTVSFQPSHEQSPEDIFNFDTKNIDKFTHKEKSILLSDIGQTNHIHTHTMQNIIFNKLYDESQILCNVSLDDGIPHDDRNENFVEINYKIKSEEDTHECPGEQHKR